MDGWMDGWTDGWMDEWMGNREGWREDVDWMHLAQDRDQWQALMNTVLNLRVQKREGNFLTS
jgi:hypothetical protein